MTRRVPVDQDGAAVGGHSPAAIHRGSAIGSDVAGAGGEYVADLDILRQQLARPMTQRSPQAPLYGCKLARLIPQSYETVIRYLRARSCREQQSRTILYRHFRTAQLQRLEKLQRNAMR